MSTLPASGSGAASFALRDAAGNPCVFGPEGPAAPATLLFFFKHDCATCDLTAPLVERVHRALSGAGLRVLGVSQDGAALTAAFAERHGLTFPRALDADLLASEEYGFDAVPALVLADENAGVLASFEGFGRADLMALVELAAGRCGIPSPAIEHEGESLPESRPGCGSKVHDPDVARRLAARRDASKLAARRVRMPADLDPFEFIDQQGLTDGLPVVPPTEERVARMLAGTSRQPGDVVADVPPNLAPATVEKVAINAVMAGCKPEYLPVVIAAVEAACTDAFNLHGVLATTYFVGPLLIVNGPIRQRIGLNCGRNVFGQGTRANATIGRALQLVVRNVGGGRPGEVDMSTLGQPGKFGACIGENEELSCWEPLHVERGFDRDQSTVTVFAAEAPRAVRDQLSRNSRSLAASMGFSLEAIAHVKHARHGPGAAGGLARARAHVRARRLHQGRPPRQDSAGDGPATARRLAERRVPEGDRRAGVAERVAGRRRPTDRRGPGPAVPEVLTPREHPDRGGRRHGGQVLRCGRRVGERRARIEGGHAGYRRSRVTVIHG